MTGLSLSAVEREVGLSRETLRIWERRYGFPSPARDTRGERAYPLDQVRKLLIIRRLIDSGHRPGRIVRLPTEALAALAATPEPTQPRRVEVVEILKRLQRSDSEGLRVTLAEMLRGGGLRRFVVDLAPDLLEAVGLAWASGEIGVHHEHLFSQQFAGVVRAALAEAAAVLGRGGAPCVLMTTFPGEAHGLGLLLAEAIFAMEGCRAVNLGVETPVDQIAAAAFAHAADLIALSFSSSYPRHHSRGGLAELRAQAPPGAQIWVGGGGAGSRRPGGVVRVRSLDEIASAVATWRKARPGA